MQAILKEAVNAHNQGDLQKAQQLYQEILASDPDNPRALHYLGVIASQNNMSLGLSYMERSLLLQPDNPEFNYNIAGIYARYGESQKASKHFEKAIALKPDYAEAYQGLTESKECGQEPDLLNRIKAQLNSETTTADQKVYLHFAAAKIYEDSKEYDQAFDHYQKGNTLKSGHYDKVGNSNLTQEIIRFFDDKWVNTHREFGLYSHTPIFIVGMPRSGTSLVEQILASHSQVFGAGELADINLMIGALINRTKNRFPYPQFLTEVVDQDLLGYGQSYLQRLSQISGNSRRVVDKNPSNFLRVGLILQIFPNAKIIHTQRDPLDNCLSCYFNNFARGHYYTNSLESLAAYYNDYTDLMRHWQRIYPGRIHTLSYEALIENQQQVTRDLLDYCNLEWEEQCLAFYKSKRNVTTASKHQVRRPLYKSSVKRWEHYKAHIQPLIAKLNNE